MWGRAYGRHAVDDGTDRTAMGFTISVNSVDVAKGGHFGLRMYVCEVVKEGDCRRVSVMVVLYFFR